MENDDYKKKDYRRVNKFVLLLEVLGLGRNRLTGRIVKEYSSISQNSDPYDEQMVAYIINKVCTENEPLLDNSFLDCGNQRERIADAIDNCLGYEEKLNKIHAGFCSRFDRITYPKRMFDCASNHFDKSSDRLVGDGKRVRLPNLLFYKGNFDIINSFANSCAIIGTRKCSQFAFNIAHDVAKAAVSYGFSVVSGLALGCDTAGHEGCLDAGGKTIAVMATGIDLVYPNENTRLADRIVANGGVLMCEQMLGEPAKSWTFISRDRIQAMLSDKVIVIQTASGRGAMHAAKAAYEFGIQIYVVDPKAFKPSDDVSGNRELIERYGAVSFSRDDIGRIFEG